MCVCVWDDVWLVDHFATQAIVNLNAQYSDEPSPMQAVRLPEETLVFGSVTRAPAVCPVQTVREG